MNVKFLSDRLLEGIQFVTNAAGEKTVVLIDLKQYGELWEDSYDGLIARQRADEPRESLESVREALKQQDNMTTNQRIERMVIC